MTGCEDEARVKQLQAAGNALYSEGRYDDARGHYTQALVLVETALGAVSTDKRHTSDQPIPQPPAAAVSASQLLSNRAQTYIQERNFAAALHGAWSCV